MQNKYFAEHLSMAAYDNKVEEKTACPVSENCVLMKQYIRKSIYILVKLVWMMFT